MFLFHNHIYLLINIGTLAFGSLILSFVRMIRVLLEWIEEKIKEHGAENPLMKCILCCCKCCFWCLEKFIRFINRNRVRHGVSEIIEIEKSLNTGIDNRPVSGLNYTRSLSNITSPSSYFKATLRKYSILKMQYTKNK